MTCSCTNRRNFLSRTGGALIAAGGISGLTFLPNRLLAADPAMTQSSESQAAISPEMALQMLKDGNARFTEGRMVSRDLMGQVAATGPSQYPFAAIVSCIDSRTSVELVFDHGIGDVFSARIAGNFVNDDILGSLEFACAIAGARLVLVLGHSECGAIKGAIEHVVMGNLTQTLANLTPAVAAVPGFEPDRSAANDAFVQAVADMNVALTVERIRERSPILRDMETNGHIAIAGAMYDVHSGVVTFNA